MVESPVVWFDEARGRYGMVCTGYDWRFRDRRGSPPVGAPRIGLAWSDDLLTWDKDARSPILGPSDVPGAPDEVGPFL